MATKKNLQTALDNFRDALRANGFRLERCEFAFEGEPTPTPASEKTETETEKGD